jgi:GTP-binding protein
MRDFGHTKNEGGKSLRVNYVTQTRVGPPGFKFFCNHPTMVDDNYRRYVENRLRERFDFTGTPVILKFRKKD